MCIIAIKDRGVALPSKKQLKMCWTNNPDGAGYMYPSNGKVVIKKGFMGFKEFYKSILYDYARYTKDTPFIMHFRISTQGGVNQQCCHPFPLSRNMEDLRKTRIKSDIGVAHNGTIELTRESWGSRCSVTYSDTMKFITDYLSLIIKDNDFYKDDDTMELIERLVDSKLAIMDNTGHISLIGEFETAKDGMIYSNETYRTERYKKTTVYSTHYTTKWHEDDYYDWDTDEYWGGRQRRRVKIDNDKKQETKKTEEVINTDIKESKYGLLSKDKNGAIVLKKPEVNKPTKIISEEDADNELLERYDKELLEEIMKKEKNNATN